MWVGRLKRWSKLLNDNKNHILIRKRQPIRVLRVTTTNASFLQWAVSDQSFPALDHAAFEVLGRLCGGAEVDPIDIDFTPLTKSNRLMHRSIAASKRS